MRTAACLAALAGSAITCTAQVIHDNGPLATGATLSSGPAAPAGYQWSEMPNGNSTLGFVALRYADDVTLGATTQAATLDVFGYVSDMGTTTSPFTSATLQIWNGPPGLPGSFVIFGNTTTNRLASSTLAGVMRTRYQMTETNRIAWRNRITVGTTLSPGTYWLDWGLNTGTVPPVTIPGAQGKPAANARHFTVAIGFWRDAEDGATHINQDYPFILNGSGGTPACYANCDSSTATPVLNVADFTCFLQKYAAGCGAPAGCMPNCDNSTAIPFLNVADFTCFLQKYAGGCGP